MSKRKRIKYKLMVGDNGMFGVCDNLGAVLYEASFTKAAAKAIVDLENSDNPPKDWFATEKILRQMGIRIGEACDEQA